MIKMQFRDMFGHKTLVTFWTQGLVTVQTKEVLVKYTKDSPIAGMYQRMLHDCREVSPGLFQVIGAW